MKKDAWDELVSETVLKQVQQLRNAVSVDAITEDDHDRIGMFFQHHIAQLLSLSDKAWTMFKLMVDEQRKVQQIEHED